MLESIDLLKIFIFALMGGYATFLANKAIAVYHDGLRPIMPEFMNGNMSRKELAGVSFAISIGFITGFALPISIATGIIVIHIILLTADFIGVSIANTKVSVAIGAIYGGSITLVLDAVIKSFEYLPVNFLDALSAVGMPVIYAFVAFPAVTVAYQFGVRKGVYTLIASLAGQIAIEAINPILIVGEEVSLSPQGIALLVGMTFLLTYAAKDKSVGIDIENSVFEDNIQRIKGNAKYLIPMGALLAVAANYQWIAGEPIAGSLLGQDKLVSAAIVAIVQALAFMPLIVTTSMISGVYGTNGWCDWLLGAGYLAPNPIVAAGAGAALMGVEVKSLGGIGRTLHRFPALKESGDNIRTAMTGILEIALLVGGVYAANDIWEGVGMFAVVSLYILNEIAGRPVMKMAAAPLGAIIVGIAANIAAILGLITVA